MRPLSVQSVILVKLQGKSLQNEKSDTFDSSVLRCVSTWFSSGDVRRKAALQILELLWKKN